MKVAGIFVGAGKGRRLGLGSKAFIRIKNRPLFYYTLKNFIDFKELKEFVFVAGKNEVKKAKGMIEKYFPALGIKVVEGGLRRSQSVKNGLNSISDDVDYILIHDIARPFVDTKSIKALLDSVKRFDNCVLGSPVSCALKKIKTTKSGKKIISTISRKNLYQIHTPQIFKTSVIKDAYRKYFLKQAFDDSQIVRCAGFNVYIIEDNSLNIKITYPEDLLLARALLK